MASSNVVVESWLRELIGEAEVPARRISASRYSVTGYVATTKAPGAQEAESSLEHDFLTLLEYERRVERFLAQPFTIEWRDDKGRKRRYTPDVVVKYSFAAACDDPHLRTTIFEVKPEAVLRRDWGELRPKLRAAIGWAWEHDCRFHIVTEREIRTPYLANVRFLLGYRSHFLRDDPALIGERQHLILRTLFKLRHSTPRGLLEAATPDRTLQAELIPWIWNLVIQRLIGVDLALPLTMASPIWPGEDAKILEEAE